MDYYDAKNWLHKKLNECIQNNTEMLNLINERVRILDIVSIQVQILLEASKSASMMVDKFVDPKDDDELQEALSGYIASVDFIIQRCNEMIVGNMCLLKRLESGQYDELCPGIDLFKQSFATSITQSTGNKEKLSKIKNDLSKYRDRR